MNAYIDFQRSDLEICEENLILKKKNNLKTKKYIAFIKALLK